MSDVDDNLRAAVRGRVKKGTSLAGASLNDPSAGAPGETSSFAPEPGAGDRYLHDLLGAARRRQEHVPGVTDPPPPAEGLKGTPARALPGGAHVRPPEPEDTDAWIRKAVDRAKYGA